jgi:acyl-CoA synthetase (AMP-forming)/AMP-acid ligase II
MLSKAGAPSLGTRLSIDEDGEILAASNTVMGGYWNTPAETETAIRDGQFHTGDGGSLDASGYLTISDRKKDVIITGGENVSSIEVEDVLLSHPAVAEVTVIAVPDDEWGEMVTALVVLRDGENVAEIELIEHTRRSLAGYKMPKQVLFTDRIPRTATGKVQKFKLRAEFWTGDRRVN